MIRALGLTGKNSCNFSKFLASSQNNWSLIRWYQNVYVHFSYFRAFSVHSQACEAGVIDVQVQPATESSNIKNDTVKYQTFDESNSKKPKHQTACYDVSYFKDGDDPTSSSSLRDLMVVLALTFHAIFEGIAVGLEDEVEHVWLLFAG